MPSPICTVQDGAGAATATTNGVNITPANTITIALAGVASVTSWQISCVYTDETSSAAAINSALTVNSTAKTATFTAPAAGKALIFQSTINGGLGPDGLPLASYTTTFGVFTLTAGGARVAAMNQTYEGDATYGWTGTFNYIVRNPSVGVTPGGIDGDVQVKSGSTLIGKTATTVGTSLLCTSANTVAFGAIPLSTAAATTGTLALTKLAAPTGTGVATVTAGAWDAASSVGLSLTAAGFITFGTTPSTTGSLRWPSAGGSVLTLLSVKNTSAADTPIIRTGTGDVVTFGNVGQDVSLVSTVNGFVAFGATPAASGLIRVAYAGGGTVTILSVKNSTSADTAILTTGPGDACAVGNVALDMTLRAVTFSGLISSGGFSATTGKQLIYSNAVNLWVGSFDSTGTSQHTLTTIAAATAVEIISPVRGNSAGSANQPFRWSVATITGAPTSVTATQAQYSCPIITVTTGTAAAGFNVVLPLVAGAPFTVYNASAFTIQVGGSTGLTVGLTAGQTSLIFCDGTNYRKIT